MHNFILMNKYIIKSIYSIYRINEIINTIIKSKFDIYFYINAFNGYWVILIKNGNQYKIEFIISYNQYIYL